MSEQKVIGITEAVNQINNTLLALTRIAAHSNPDVAKAYLGAAVYASRQQGSGDNFVLEIYQKTFPGQELPTVLSDEDFAKKVSELKS